ncbi:transmembrane emp24 domain-containing protein 9-like [Epinephelus moara]|uniref:transmembrane emp24 domain-containing protein 9-like n=1 Tax=Epinephelus moara TaxID=300413 RepID=UPI00214E1CD2|nr:transmembrane emp24 domain-containing protein 9-like [Epinephelus moara]
MASVKLLTVFFLLNCLSSFVSCLFFHIGDTERKCFIQELPDETPLIGNYWTELYDTQRDEYLPTPQDHRIHVSVKDPDDKVVLSRPFPSEGTFRFTSHTPGEHQICLQPDSSQPAGGLLTVHLDIRVGEGTYSYPELAVKDKQTKLALRVRQLIEQVEYIKRGYSYHRYKEEHFRLTNYNTNMWIFWWPVIRSLYVVLFIIWHTKSW